MTSEGAKKSLAARWHSLSPAARASFAYILCGMLQKGIAVLVVPVYTRIMDADAYGVYTVFQSWYSLLFVFTSLGLANYVFNNGMLKYKDDRDGFSSAMLGLSSAVTLVFVAVFLLFPSFWSDLLGLAAPLVFLLLARCLITPSYEFWSARLRYEFRYKGVVALTLAFTFLIPAVSIPAILLSDDKAAAALVCQTLVMIVVYAVPLASILRKNRKLFNGKYWLYALRFNLPLIPSMFSTLALQQMDRIIIAGTSGDAPAAIYAVACSVGSVAMFVYSALDQAYRPWFYQEMEKSRCFSADGVARLLVLVVGTLCCVVALFAPEIIRVFAPVEYFDAAYAVAPVAASTVALMAFSIFITVEYYFEETRLIPLVSIVAACANYGLNVLLIPRFGYLTAGYTTIACYAMLALGHAFLCRRTIDRHIPGRAPLAPGRLLGVAGSIVGGILAVQLLYPWLVVRVVLLVGVSILVVMNRKKLTRAFGMLRRGDIST